MLYKLYIYIYSNFYTNNVNLIIELYRAHVTRFSGTPWVTHDGFGFLYYVINPPHG